MRSRRRNRGESGQGIAYVLVLSAALLVFLIAIVDLIWSESRALVRQAKSQVLVHETDAALDRAMYALLQEGNWDALPSGAVAGYRADVTYTDIPGISYRVKIQEGNWTPYDPGTGAMESTWTPAGDVDNERTITVWASRTWTGEKRKLQAIVLKSSLNSALFSGGQILIGGSADIHWGPVVSYSTASDAIPLGAIPAHPVFLSKGGITIGGQPAESAGVDSPDPLASLSVDAHSTGVGAMPVVPLAYLKAAAMGLVATDPLFYQVVGCDDSDGLPEGKMTDKTVVYFDTIDGLAWDGLGDCKTEGSNGQYIKLEGNACGKGWLVVIGTLNSKGTGCSQAVTMTPPPDCFPRYANPTLEPNECDPIANPTLLWDGTIYLADKLESSGNKKVYGTIYARDTAGVTGNFSCWYKSTNSELGLLGKTLNVALWLPRTPFTSIDPASLYEEAWP